MRKLICLMVLMGILTFGVNAIAWDFTAYSPTNYSTSTVSIYSPILYPYGEATAYAEATTYEEDWDCSSYQLLDTSTFATFTESGVFTASASAYVSTTFSFDCFDCGDPDPEPCEDLDNDGICDDVDECLDTPPDVPTDEFGCEICDEDDVQCILDKECPCGAPPPPHGDYVSCIVQWAGTLVDDGIIEPGIGTCYASIAGQSDCGMPAWQEGISLVPVYQEGECVLD